MIKGILFDYGGVVADGGRGIDLVNRLDKELNFGHDQVESTVWPLFQQMTVGNLDGPGFWQKLAEATGKAISEADQHLWDSWWGMDVYPEMLDLINRLRKNGYQLGLLSNIIPPTRDHILAGGGYSHFDFALLSCEIKIAKPDPAAFELALNEFESLSAEEIVFIDDQERNITPAQALGMRTILATSSDQIMAELRKLDINVS